MTLLALLLLTALFQDPPSEESVHESWQALRSRGAEERAQLAAWALENELYREAGLLARDVSRIVPDHEIGGITQEIEGIEAEQYARIYKKALKDHGREYRKKYRGLYQPLAKEMVAIAKQAEKLGFDDLAEDIYLDAFKNDSDNSAASSALKKRDYDLIYNYGAIPEEDKERARKVLRRLGGGFLSRRDLDDEFETWTDVWGLETEHYLFLTNAPHETVFAFAQECEDLHEAWEEMFKAAKVSTRSLRDPLVVHFYDSPATYEAIIRTRGYDAPAASTVLGFYSGGTKIGYFYDNPGVYAGELTLLFETFYHEGTHQLCDLRMKTAWRGELATFPTGWVTEGFALYMELMETRPGEKDDERTFLFGKFVDDDLEQGISLYEADELKPLDVFIHMNAEEFYAYEYGYPHAALVTHFLMETRDGAWRKHVFTLLEETQKQGGLKKSVYELLGVEQEELVAELEAHVKDVKARLPFREYARDKEEERR